MANVIAYVKESYDELLNKVTWPTWKELWESSYLVFIASLIIAGLVFVMDFVFGVNKLNDADTFWKGVIGFIYKWL